MTLEQIVANPIFLFSGWLFGLISVVFAFREHTSKKRIEGELRVLKKSSTRNTKVSGQSQYVEKNDGQITVNHK